VKREGAAAAQAAKPIDATRIQTLITAKLRSLGTTAKSTFTVPFPLSRDRGRGRGGNDRIPARAKFTGKNRKSPVLCERFLPR
jgi:hypothetical protein